MEHKLGSKATVVSMVTALLLTLGMLPAAALDLYRFRGTVRDASGRGLGGAAVTDGSRSVTTAADGGYSLGESSTGTFRLRASRWDTATQVQVVSVLVPIDTTVDFTLLYRITGALSASALSTASGPASANLTLTSYAPSPGTPGESGGKSCVTVTDSRTSVTSPATLATMNPNGTSTWTYLLSLDQGTTEGTYPLSFLARDCSSGTVVSESGGSSYTVDNTPPRIDPRDLFPMDFGNTIFLSGQPLLAKVFDDLSGINPQSVNFMLIDETTGETTYRQASAFAGTTGWAKTAAVVLTAQHLYRLSVSAADLAGNVAVREQTPGADGGGFLSSGQLPPA